MMRDVEEYSHDDYARCLEHAGMIAMCYIENKYHDLKDEDEVIEEEIRGVKNALEVLTSIHELKAK